MFCIIHTADSQLAASIVNVLYVGPIVVSCVIKFHEFVVHIHVVVVHGAKDKLILLVPLSNLSDRVAVALLLDFGPVHLHLEGVMHVSNVVPRAFDKASVNKVKFLMDVEPTVVDPKVIITVEG